MKSKRIEHIDRNFINGINFMRERMKKYNITLDEIFRNTQSDKDLIYLLLTDDKLIKDIDKIFRFFRMHIRATHRYFSIYSARKDKDDNNILIVRRKIKPYYSAKYNILKKELFNLTAITKEAMKSDKMKEVYINEMYDFMDEWFEKNNQSIK